jgi:hypothetical protein
VAHKGVVLSVFSPLLQIKEIFLIELEEKHKIKNEEEN